MAKYYIQSGNVSYIVSACDTEGAALWVMHRIMDEKIDEFETAQTQWEELTLEDDVLADLSGMSIPGTPTPKVPAPNQQRPADSSYHLNRRSQYDELGVPQAIPYDAMLEGLAQFEETICISERGFGHSEADELETEAIFHQWRQLMLAVDRLHDEMG